MCFFGAPGASSVEEPSHIQHWLLPPTATHQPHRLRAATRSYDVPFYFIYTRHHDPVTTTG